MAINIQRILRENSKVTDISELKASILAAAKVAEEAGRHDTLVIELDAGHHYISEPIALSATENPELKSLDITLRGSVSRAAEVCL